MGLGTRFTREHATSWIGLYVERTVPRSSGRMGQACRAYGTRTVRRYGRSGGRVPPRVQHSLFNAWMVARRAAQAVGSGAEGHPECNVVYPQMSLPAQRAMSCTLKCGSPACVQAPCRSLPKVQACSKDSSMYTCQLMHTGCIVHRLPIIRALVRTPARSSTAPADT